MRRHDLVWLDAEPQLERIDTAYLNLAKSWFGSGFPAVVTRQDSSEWLALGIPLPPEDGKKRIALRVRPNDANRASPPPLLDDVVTSAPSSWRKHLASLAASASASGISCRVYGSLAWQSLTSRNYLTPNSDIDLFWQAASLPQLHAGLMLLSSWEKTSGLRVDGEVWFGEGAAVAWRELLQESGTVLVKHLRSVELRERDDLLARFISAREFAQ